jgi:cardiolipin synthase A/B
LDRRNHLLGGSVDQSRPWPCGSSCAAVPVGVSLAWLTVVFVFPLAGAAVYLTFGELRLGRRRAVWAAQIREPVDRWLQSLQTRKAVDWAAQGPECEPLAKLTEATFQFPALPVTG